MTVQLPPDVRVYKRTPVFTEDNIPAGLLNDHHTKEGTWGLIRVEEGALRYSVRDARRPFVEETLTPHGPPGVVEPTIRHRVEPLGFVRFYVEFHRHPEV